MSVDSISRSLSSYGATMLSYIVSNPPAPPSFHETPSDDYLVNLFDQHKHHLLPYFDVEQIDNFSPNIPAYLEQALMSIAILIMSLFVLGLPLSIRRLWSPDLDDNDSSETDGHESFVKLWPEIQACDHANMVLPPTCYHSKARPAATSNPNIISRTTRATSTLIRKVAMSVSRSSSKKGTKSGSIGSVTSIEEEPEGADERENADHSTDHSTDNAIDEFSEATSKTPPRSPLTKAYAPSSPKASVGSGAKTGSPDVFSSPLPPASREGGPPSPLTESESHFFDAAPSKKAIRKMDEAVVMPDENGYLFDGIPEDTTPLVCFVNSKSGGNQGRVLITQMRRVLNPIQVWDLANGPPNKTLASFCALPKVRILVCGGDGTVAWILSVLEEMNLDRQPAIAVLPLGTGNDLARAHGWGGGYSNESLLEILEQVSSAYVSLLDRWEMTIEEGTGRKKKTVKKVFNNYFGLGADAQAALDFHQLREKKPELFFSRVVNKAWYTVLGAEDIFKQACSHMPETVTLIADGVEVPLPDDCQGLIFMNIDSYAGGISMWSGGHVAGADSDDDLPQKRGTLTTLSSMNSPARDRLESQESTDDFAIGDMELTEDEKFQNKMDSAHNPSSCQDGMLDIISVKGCLHIGQLTVGIGSAQRVCQAQEIEIRTTRRMPVQVDGEPWGQPKCVFKVSKKKDQGVMLHRAEKANGGDIATEMTNLLDWAENRGIIKQDQHRALMREFSRRVEIKAREKKRIASSDNLLAFGKQTMTDAFKKGASMMDLGKTPSKDRGDDGEHFLSYELSTDGREQRDDEFNGDCAVM